jgi:enediyne biosynthesis protein E4
MKLVYAILIIGTWFLLGCSSKPEKKDEPQVDTTAQDQQADGQVTDLSVDSAPLQDVFELVDSLGDRAEPDVGTEDLDLPGDEVDEVVEETYNYTPPDCPLADQWEPGDKVFEEGTEEWGLLGIEGTRLSILDVDSDGWPDLFLRRGGGPDDFGEEGTRHRWLLRNTGEGKFEDIAEASGLLMPRNPELANGDRPGDVTAAGDVDNDGDIDFFMATAIHKVEEGQETSELMLNNGDGTFSLGPVESEARREGKTSVPAGVTFVDFNRDGYLDLWMVHNMVSEMNYPLPDNLYLGDGAGNFTDVSKDAGIQTMSWMYPFQLNEALGNSWGWSSAACDLNNDGIPELLAASYGRCPNLLWQGFEEDGEVKYENVSVYSGYSYDHRMDWTDNESARCFCKLHPDAEDCEGVPPPQYVKCDTDADIFRWNHDSDREPWRLAGNSAATSCGDLDNDGHVDLFTGEIVHWDVGSSSDPAELLFNTGEEDVRFVRPGNKATGLVREYPGPVWDNGDMTNALFDFDNDGLLDVYISSSDYPYTKGLLFHQDVHRSFTRLEVDDYFEHLRSAGAVTADFDRDGDMDIIVGHSHMRCGGDYLDDCYETTQFRLFENIFGTQNGNWIQFKLEGTEDTNRTAIGARVTVTNGCHTYLRDVDGGHGHFNTQRDPVLHFGVGEAEAVDVHIRWPDDSLTTQEFTVDTNKLYYVLQGTEPEEFTP